MISRENIGEIHELATSLFKEHPFKYVRASGELGVPHEIRQKACLKLFEHYLSLDVIKKALDAMKLDKGVVSAAFKAKLMEEKGKEKIPENQLANAKSFFSFLGNAVADNEEPINTLYAIYLAEKMRKSPRVAENATELIHLISFGHRYVGRTAHELWKELKK